MLDTVLVRLKIYIYTKVIQSLSLTSSIPRFQQSNVTILGEQSSTENLLHPFILSHLISTEQINIFPFIF